MIVFRCVCVFIQDSVSEPEEFTAELQKVLKSSPQPYLVPFLKVGRVNIIIVSVTIIFCILPLDIGCICLPT